MLFGSVDTPAGPAEATRPVFEAVAAVISAKAPELSEADIARTATVAVRIVGAMMPPIAAASGAELDALIGELRRALVGYREPVEKTR